MNRNLSTGWVHRSCISCHRLFASSHITFSSDRSSDHYVLSADTNGRLHKHKTRFEFASHGFKISREVKVFLFFNTTSPFEGPASPPKKRNEDSTSPPSKKRSKKS